MVTAANMDRCVQETAIVTAKIVFFFLLHDMTFSSIIVVLLTAALHIHTLIHYSLEDIVS